MKASKSLIRDFGEIEKLQVSSKGPGDFVSSADKRTEKIIIEELLKVNPDYGIVSEEAGKINDKNKNNRWIIDPIDGTSNFLNGIPQFSISVGYEENGEIICGIIFDPIKNELFFAEKGKGSFLNNSRIRVSKKKIKATLFWQQVVQSSLVKIKKKIFQEYFNISKNVNTPIRKFGSASLDLAYVACGRLDGFWQRELNYWDIAAGIVIVKESGGFIEFFDNEKALTDKNNVVSTNSMIHQDLLELIKKKY